MAQSAVNTGLESLAAEASRRAESMEAHAEAGPSTEATGSKSASQNSGHKGKVRKAYTITKQRERWTDSEHERFLQALKRYGRAWRKIEEHIGTKTAVQIRSHAQKFFSKLQREQSANGALGDESSKAGISIPPPRPKRKPMHPYPRKNGDSPTAEGSSRQPQAAAKQPGPAVTATAPTNAPLPALDIRGGEVSLSQVLETAAMAAANAWSQVVAGAGSKVQQQLQQGLQSMQPLLGMSPTLLYQMAAQQQQEQPHLAANLHSSSQHPMGRSPFLNGSSLDCNLAAASAAPNLPAQTQSIQDSPDGAGNAADQGNDRDSACSKEYNRGQSSSGTGLRLSSGRQTLPRIWTGIPQQQQSPDGRLGRAGLELMTQMQAAKAAAQQSADPLRLATLARNPSRAFSAGPILHLGGTSHQEKKAAQPCGQGAEPESSPHNGAQSHSDTSQLARYYQQAAEEQQAAQDADNIENGSSGEGGSSSGDGSNGKLGLPRSDKGSNMGNSGSDEDAHGNGSSGSRSDVGVNDQANANGNDGKGSDEGSNSPPGVLRNNSPAATDRPKPVPANGKLQKPSLFVLGSGIDNARLAAATAELQQQQKAQQPLPTQLPPPQPNPMAPKLPDPALSALQQQALNAWASSIQQPGAATATHNGYQLLQGLISKMQAAGTQSIAAATSPSPSSKPTGDTSLCGRKSSGGASMDTFNANSSRSFSFPLGVANGSVCQGGPNGGNVEAGGGGFKPYNKRHGMPGMALPPSKRFESCADKPRPAAGQAVPLDSSQAHGGFVQPGHYSLFGSLADRTRQL